MTARWLLPLVLLSATALLPSAANAQPLLHDAVAVVADPVTLDREVQAGAIPFQVHVVYLNARNLMPTIGALQFGLEVDPGLTVIGHSTSGLLIQPAPLEYALVLQDCVGVFGPSVTVAVTLNVIRDETCPRAPESASKASTQRANRCSLATARATRCSNR